jgi:hypothetical protein
MGIVMKIPKGAMIGAMFATTVKAFFVGTFVRVRQLIMEPIVRVTPERWRRLRTGVGATGICPSGSTLPSSVRVSQLALALPEGRRGRNALLARSLQHNLQEVHDVRVVYRRGSFDLIRFSTRVCNRTVIGLICGF